MIHRKFIGLSFSNSAFSFTRRTCIAASKTILKEALSGTEDHGPTLWIEQAFSVAAGIILSLDTFHRSASEREFEEHQKLVKDAISYLRTYEDSKIASRGVQLLSGLQRELQEGGSANPRKRQQPAEFGDLTPSFSKRARTFNVESFINNVSRDLQVTTPTTSDTDVPANAGDTSWNSFMNLVPLQTGFGGQSLFDDLLSFQF
ncbi:hypothetical protein ACET3X_006765 [Alternaria dauci]|uniref:Uncharacterized protein n=1 Tax=Alternaria dauci TaxID=48095 RepID=A0ABR3UF40_9PLEO